jgi:hypothetical protein
MTWEQRFGALAELDGDGWNVAYERLETEWRAAYTAAFRRDCRIPRLAAGGCRDVAAGIIWLPLIEVAGAIAAAVF